MFRFKPGLPPHHVALAMIGAKPGQLVLFLGSQDPDLAAEVALVTGLNGRTVLVDRGPGVADRVQAAAGKAGALIELVDAPLTMLPLDADAFDIVVVNAALAGKNAEQRSQVVAEAVRVAAPGRRVVVIEGAKRSGLFGLLPAMTASLDEATGRSLLADAGTLGARLLADVDGLAFFEGRKRGREGFLVRKSPPDPFSKKMTSGMFFAARKTYPTYFFLPQARQVAAAVDGDRLTGDPPRFGRHQERN